jgi:hypothetical protein
MNQQGGTSALHHRNGHAPDFALGGDLYGLFVAPGPQREVGGKSRGIDEDVDLAIIDGAQQIAENVPARFAPSPGNLVALARDIAAQVEFVAIAGAMQVLLEARPGAVNLVLGLASDVLGRSVGERNRPVA